MKDFERFLAGREISNKARQAQIDTYKAGLPEATVVFPRHTRRTKRAIYMALPVAAALAVLEVACGAPVKGQSGEVVVVAEPGAMATAQARAEATEITGIIATQTATAKEPTAAAGGTKKPDSGGIEQNEVLVQEIDKIVLLLKSLGNFEKYFEDVKGGDVLIGRGRVQQVIGGDNPNLKYKGTDQVLTNTPMEKGLLGVAREAILTGDKKTAQIMLDKAEIYLTLWSHDRYTALTPENTPDRKFGRGGKAGGGVISIPEYAEAYFQVVELQSKIPVDVK